MTCSAFYHGSGTSKSWQIFRTKKSSISRWRGIAVVFLLARWRKQYDCLLHATFRTRASKCRIKSRRFILLSSAEAHGLRPRQRAFLRQVGGLLPALTQLLLSDSPVVLLKSRLACSLSVILRRSRVTFRHFLEAEICDFRSDGIFERGTGDSIAAEVWAIRQTILGQAFMGTRLLRQHGW